MFIVLLYASSRVLWLLWYLSRLTFVQLVLACPSGLRSAFVIPGLLKLKQAHSGFA